MTQAKESVFHVVDRLGNHHAITADSMNSDGDSVVFWVGGSEVASFLCPLSSQRGASVVPATESLLAIGSAFLSSPDKSPLVEAIESAARLLREFESVGRPADRGSAGVPGRLVNHLDELLGEQSRQMIALGHDLHPVGKARRA